MTRKMLIDATHPEETRVAVVNGTKLEEYDYETLVRKQLKGNIYLVKVTRVEPSLQAAFVDFGGNRHGFLSFPEIHHDYYRIPIADREALIAEERALAAAQAAREDEEDAALLAESGEEIEEPETIEIVEPGEEDAGEEEGEVSTESYVPRHAGSIAADIGHEAVADDEEDEAEEAPEAEEAEEHGEEAVAAAAEEARDEDKDEDVDTVGGDVVDAPAFRSSVKRHYKIQEVIKRNQIMLIQINKEERGNKGAAVTSYISLPGRYCVLMPNSPRGGGVSRKVSNARDRQKLKVILRELNVPEGMSVILRTAGVARTVAEIKRDLDYLLRLWDEIRELTLKSTAPALIYEEGNLIKRAIRDLYRRDIAEVLVAGTEGFRSAHEFMRTLMPSHAEKVMEYNTESVPLFSRFQVESQIDAIHSPTVHLKSGGYIVINPTEALVSIDINSGKATKGRHIEETALKTNIEAAEEIARQLRLRDLGGLIVIDFIDMEDRRGNRTVEKRLRDAMASDRARIQLGRISAFGLLELSRQRLHPSLVETNFETCRHCTGSGLTRTVETSAVIVLRAIEEECLKGRAAELKVSVPTEIALYVFNVKREMLAAIEKRHNVRVFLGADDSLIKPAYNIEMLRSSGVQKDNRPRKPAPVQSVDMSDLPEVAEGGDEATIAEEEFGGTHDFQDGNGDGGERRGGGRGRDRNHGRDRDRDGAGDGDGNRRGRRGGRNRRGGGRDRDNGHEAGPRGRDGGNDFGGGEQPRVNFDEAQPREGRQAHGGQGGGENRDANGGQGRDANGGQGRDANGGQGRDGDGKRRRRRGGRGRNRERGERGDRGPQGNNGGHGDAHGGGGGGSGQQPRQQHQSAQAAPSAPPSSDAVAFRHRSDTIPEPRHSAPPVNDGGGEGGGGSRKGWWKRLTE